MRLFTAGESHGAGLVALLDGVPAGVPIAAADIDGDLRRRQLGYGRGARQRIERDAVSITGGVRHGRSTGAPIALQIANRDAVNWERVMSVEPVTEPPAAITRTCATSSSARARARPRRASPRVRSRRPC